MKTIQIDVNGETKNYSVNPDNLSPLKLLKLLNLDQIREGSEEAEITELLLQALYGENETAIFQELSNLFPEFIRDYVRLNRPLPGNVSGEGYAFVNGGEVVLLTLIAALVEDTDPERGEVEKKAVETAKEVPPNKGFAPQKEIVKNKQPQIKKTPLVPAAVNQPEKQGISVEQLQIIMEKYPEIELTPGLFTPGLVTDRLEDEF